MTMKDTPLKPTVRFLTDDAVRFVLEQAKVVLEQVGMLVEHSPAQKLLQNAGARVDADGRTHIPATCVDRAVATAPKEIQLYDRDAETAVRIGGDDLCFNPGSAAIKVLDHATGLIRLGTQEDCTRFARLTEHLPALAMQSTCVVPSDVEPHLADSTRLCRALQDCRKPVVTGTFDKRSFERMRRMLVCVRGSEEALRQRPLAIFDCCPSPPLRWSALTCDALVGCAEHGIPATLLSMPLTGATAPVTLLGAVVQHAAENLSGLVIHQLAGPGAPVLYGGAPAAFDMRHGTTPMGAVETLMIDAAYSEVGRHLGLPVHSYMALSDAKTHDYQAGLETGFGATMAAFAAVNLVSGPGMLELVSCQSLEKLLLDHEACRMALRAAHGIDHHDDPSPAEVIREGVSASQFLKLRHTRRFYRQELSTPGPTIDRQVADAWVAAGSKTAAQRAHEQVESLLAGQAPAPLDPALCRELQRL